MHPGHNALDIATIVKLTRTLAILPIHTHARLLPCPSGQKAAQGKRKRVHFSKIFPFFILFFLLASIITTVCTMSGIPAVMFHPFKELSKFFIIMAMLAIGLGTDLVKLVKTGGKPVSWVCAAGSVLPVSAWACSMCWD